MKAKAHIAVPREPGPVPGVGFSRRGCGNGTCEMILTPGPGIVYHAAGSRNRSRALVKLLATRVLTPTDGGLVR